MIWPLMQVVKWSVWQEAVLFSRDWLIYTAVCMWGGFERCQLVVVENATTCLHDLVGHNLLPSGSHFLPVVDPSRRLLQRFWHSTTQYSRRNKLKPIQQTIVRYALTRQKRHQRTRACGQMYLLHSHPQLCEYWTRRALLKMTYHLKTYNNGKDRLSYNKYRKHKSNKGPCYMLQVQSYTCQKKTEPGT